MRFHGTMVVEPRACVNSRPYTTRVVMRSCGALFQQSACSHREDAEVTPPGTVASWTLVEDLLIGDDGDDDPAKSFNDIRGIAVTRTGSIFVLDHGTRDIRMFDRTGNFRKFVARRGEGPGEIQFGNGLAVDSHDSVWVSDISNARFSLYSPEGVYVRQIATSLTMRGDCWPGVVNDAGDIVDLQLRVATWKSTPGQSVFAPWTKYD